MKLYHKRWANPNQVNFSVLLVLLLGALLAGGVFLGTRGTGFNIFKPANVQAAERGYDIGVKAAIAYGDLCLGYADAAGGQHAAVLPRSCVSTWNKIDAAYQKATLVYFQLCYGTATPPAALQGTPCTADDNASSSLVDQLNTAITLLQAVTPA